MMIDDPRDGTRLNGSGCWCSTRPRSSGKRPICCSCCSPNDCRGANTQAIAANRSGRQHRSAKSVIACDAGARFMKEAFSSQEIRMLTLRSSPASPFGRKVKIAASLLDLIDRIEVVETDTNNPQYSLRQQNPLGKIPTLVLENGETLYDSRVILEYLDELAGGGHIYPAGWDRFAALAPAGARRRHHGCGVDPGLRGPVAPEEKQTQMARSSRRQGRARAR